MDTKLREKNHTNSTCNKEEINYVGVEYLCLGSRYEVEKRELTQMCMPCCFVQCDSDGRFTFNCDIQGRCHFVVYQCAGDNKHV